MPGNPSGVDYSLLRRIVHAHSSNVLDPSRDFIFDARLARLIRHHGMSNLADLVEHLRTANDPALESAVADAMTINETSFFRDCRPFELLRTQLLPRLIEARRPLRTLRLWSAACSTGQEAYSLAIVLREHFPHLANWRLRIYGTDICEQAVRRAQAGRFERIEVNRGLPARMLPRYFLQDRDEWIVKPEIRDICRFSRLNLVTSPLALQGRFDIVFLRNVMLYFEPEVRRAVLAQVRRFLAPDGVLFLGSSEQPADTSAWSAVLAGGTSYYLPR